MTIRFRVTEATETYGLLRSTFTQVHDLLAREMEDAASTSATLTRMSDGRSSPDPTAPVREAS